MEGLPDPTSLDLFQYRDIRGTLQTLNPPDPELRPRVITDYVIDPAKWAAETVNTVEGVLTRAAGHPDRECLSCAGVGDYCLEPRDCIQSWRDAVASVGQSALESKSILHGWKPPLLTHDNSTGDWQHGAGRICDGKHHGR